MVDGYTYLVVKRGESRDEEALENVFVIPIDRHFGDSTADCQQGSDTYTSFRAHWERPVAAVLYSCDSQERHRVGLCKTVLSCCDDCSERAPVDRSSN